MSVITVGENLDRDGVAPLLAGLDAQIQQGPERVTLDLGKVQRFDSAGMGAVVEGMRRAKDRGVDVRLRGISEPMLEFFSLVSMQRLLSDPNESKARVDPVSRLGLMVIPALQTLKGITDMAGQVLHGIVVAPFQGKGLRLDRAVAEFDHAASGALPIVALISFLLGLILAMQAYVQLRLWGADIYMADMVGVSIMTEIGPLMTAIILAARSGSRNAAQLGSMVVGEEIDALEQMGIHPLRFLVVPKVIALSLAVVALGVVFDLIGMCGGALFGFMVADIEPQAYAQQTQQALNLADFLAANLKCLAFGTCIGVVGCALGLRVKGGSEGVGRATTSAVVLSIFLIIIIDSVFVTAQRMLL